MKKMLLCLASAIVLITLSVPQTHAEEPPTSTGGGKPVHVPTNPFPPQR